MFREWREEIEEIKEEAKEKYYIDDEGYLQGIKITKHPVTRLEFTLKMGLNQKLLFCIEQYRIQQKAHYILGKKVRSYGAHFFIDKDGTIYQCASLYKYTQHVGPTKSKIYPKSSENIGIEVVAWYNDKAKKWDEVTLAQKESIKNIVEILKKEYKLNNNDIYEHEKYLLKQMEKV